MKPTILGERHECYAVTEEHAGSDTDAIRATARRDGDGYVLNGEKWHVTSFNVADHIFFQAKLTEGSHAGSLALFIVDVDTPGVRHVRRRNTATPIATSTPWSLSRTSASRRRTSSARRATGCGTRTPGSGTSGSAIAARSCGAAERLIDEASRFVAGRGFGRDLTEYQGVTFPLADSLAELWAHA